MKSILPIITVCSGFILLSACSSGEKSPAGKGPGGGALPIEVVVVKQRYLERKINVTGTLLANEEVELRSELSGKVTRINFEEGMPVNKGQVLFKINDSELQAQLQRVRLQDSLLTSEENRKRQLLKLKAISQEEYDRALTELQSVRADQQLLKAQMDKAIIVAPFDGQIGLRSISEGGFTDPGKVLATMQQINPIKIDFAVPEKYRAYLRPGTSISFTVSGIDSLFQAEVYAIEARIDQNTRSVQVRARCSNKSGLLFPGAFAKVEIVLEEVENAIVIPAEAVVPELKGQKVFVIRNGKALSVPVETGIRSGTETEITMGLSAGDTLAVTGILQLRNEAPVAVTAVR
jgi:membrane fusion protein, multidrug efflux system